MRNRSICTGDAGIKITDLIYNRLSDYYKKRYGGNIKKLCIDGGFSCPNRDGTKGYGGCIFCNEKGSGEQIKKSFLSVENQIENGIAKLNPHEKAIAYYQNFTNTYAPLETLKRIFGCAVKNDSIVGLNIATRPDCISNDTLLYLAELNEKKDITVELGLQTANDKTAQLINRCYKSEEFTKAVTALNNHNISVLVHIILGLPTENEVDLMHTVEFLNMHKYAGIKIHSLYVTKDTPLAEMYLNGSYTPITKSDYVKQAAYVLTHISPDVIVHRLTGDGDKSKLLAPDFTKDKIRVINSIFKELFDNNLSQGCYYKK